MNNPFELIISSQKVLNICKICNNYYYGWGNHPDLFNCVLALLAERDQKDIRIAELEAENKQLQTKLNDYIRAIEALKYNLIKMEETLNGHQ